MKRVCLGKIAGPHGIKGLVKIIPFGDDPSLIETLGPVYTSETGPETLSITLKNSQGKYILAQVEGIDSRDKSENLDKRSLFVPREALPAITDEDTFYYEDLIGMAVRDEQDTPIGKVLAVHNFGAGDLLDIQPDTGGDSFLLPFQDDTVIHVGETIVIRHYEGFME